MRKPVYFVTGANGFIGASLCRKLATLGIHTKALFHTKMNHPYFDELKVEPVWGDILAPESFEAELSDVDGVFHCAAFVSFDDVHQQQIMDVNGQGTQKLIHVCKKMHVPRILFLSAGAVWGTYKSAGKLIGEKNPYQNPAKSSYAQSKIAAEHYCREAHRNGQHVVIVNPSTVYGAGDYGLQAGGRVVKSVSQSRFSVAPSGGTAWIDISDLLEGILAAYAHGKSGEQYILSSENISYYELMVQIRNACGRFTQLVQLPTVFKIGFSAAQKMDEILRYFGLKLPVDVGQLVESFEYKSFSSHKARMALSFSPQVPLIQSLLDTRDFNIKHEL